MATHEIILAGFGGQGILFAGKLLAYCGMVSDKELSWLPSYGPEMRGGTCNCHVILSDEPVSSPLITKPTILFAMNQPSLEKFEGKVAPGGFIIYDSSLIASGVTRTDVTGVALPATQLAHEMNESKLANMILMGSLIKHTGIIDIETVKKALTKVVPAKKPELYDVNLNCILKGMEN
ncbi:MAG: 2-oxoacid:acceptor oxidoreductase family protein [Bacillota bacterium]|nr:2-oxoacid:acceptor oxidoreductase family protein [Bacillota bacterium]